MTSAMTSGAQLVDAAELDAWRCGDAPPLLLDMRWSLAEGADTSAYRDGHLPGAVFADLDRVCCAPPGPAGRHPLPTTAGFQAAARALGVSGDRAVVVYDVGDMLPAARAWWTLRYFGHPEVYVLDGGYDAWRRAGLPVRAGEREAGVPGDFAATPGGMPVLDAEAAAELAHAGTLVDVRAAPRYRGESEPIDPVAGHIPGAVNLPSADDLCPGGGLRSVAELADRYAPLPAEVGAYCGSGITAARTVLALATTGRTAALYPGSWSNWIADPARPVATGDH